MIARFTRSSGALVRPSVPKHGAPTCAGAPKKHSIKKYPQIGEDLGAEGGKRAI